MDLFQPFSVQMFCFFFFGRGFFFHFCFLKGGGPIFKGGLHLADFSQIFFFSNPFTFKKNLPSWGKKFYRAQGVPPGMELELCFRFFFFCGFFGHKKFFFPLKKPKKGNFSHKTKIFGYWA